MDEYQTINDGSNIRQTYFHHATYYWMLILMRMVPRVMTTIIFNEGHHHDDCEIKMIRAMIKLLHHRSSTWRRRYQISGSRSLTLILVPTGLTSPRKSRLLAGICKGAASDNEAALLRRGAQMGQLARKSNILQAGW